MGKAKGKVRAFWVLPGPTVMGEATSLAEAVCDGDIYNGPTGHHWLWSQLQKPASLSGRIYTTVPRGRVLYRARQERFVIFASPEIINNANVRLAVEAFYDLSQAQEWLIWRTDPHYVTQPTWLMKVTIFLESVYLLLI